MSTPTPDISRRVVFKLTGETPVHFLAVEYTEEYGWEVHDGTNGEIFDAGREVEALRYYAEVFEFEASHFQSAETKETWRREIAQAREDAAAWEAATH